MPKLMRCEYCGLLQDEPTGVKSCSRCGGELRYETRPSRSGADYLHVQMELDQVMAPAGQNVDRYLLVTIRTPAQVPEGERAPTRTGRPTVGLAAALDISGSMHGVKVQYAKQAVHDALEHLQDDDLFSLVTFASEAHCTVEPTLLEKQRRKDVLKLVESLQASGQTALCSGLEMGIDKAASFQQSNSLVMLVSDGQANVGETDVEAVGSRAALVRKKGMVVSTLGIGDDYNEALLANIASEGGGRFYHLDDPAKLTAFLTGELGEVANLAARDVKLHLNLPQGAALVPISSAYTAQTEADVTTVSIGVLPADTELEVALRLILPPHKAGGKLCIEGSLAFKSPSGNWHEIAVNRVTVRYVELVRFGLSEGVVAEVAERMLNQMKASAALSFSLAMAKGQAPSLAAVKIRAGVCEYATRLGGERAAIEESEMNSTIAKMMASTISAKRIAHAAFATMRAAKDFN